MPRIETLQHLPPAADSHGVLAAQFTDLAPPLSARQAAIEAARCLYCYDAPCMRACPTGIDVASFIRNIHDQNIDGAAIGILEQNILGGSYARGCPTEIVCESACVRNHYAEREPVKIGLLQRHAVDNARFTGHLLPVRRRPARPLPWWAPAQPDCRAPTVSPCWATMSWSSRANPRRAA